MGWFVATVLPGAICVCRFGSNLRVMQALLKNEAAIRAAVADGDYMEAAGGTNRAAALEIKRITGDTISTF